ncbi:serine carboxypeptidase 1 isoform X2 [Amborella trichopoda]|uniref:serine carboxypeptidase 1 isoform X2 n=1 Tax=Amborella trichopoda TaxID=13333 RepID=UPI0005D3B16F|nr:serine carboxypeptidase 1 isoform X2 [Amborella trichopoda]|eukprot:XP_011623125.1 serine carboxypeptidase 1 isoform X2 [Amborella trichopoda]
MSHFLSSPFSPLLIAIIASLLCSCVVESAPDGAEVLRFPGFDGPLPSKHYAGYITLGNQVNKKHLYYYFATSERDLSKDPVVFWINGGPGCSGMNAVVYLLGPFKIDNDRDYMKHGVKVKLSPFSWTKVSSIVYVDSPAGTGFSYADNSDDYETDDSKTIADLYEFILKWYRAYPEFLSNPLYVAGSSYAGVYVPVLSLEIAKGIEAGAKPKLNFKGYSVSNGLTDSTIDTNSGVTFAHRVGLISDKLYNDLRISCQGNYWNSSDPDCLRNMAAYQENTGGINRYHILCLPCHYEMGISSRISYEEKEHKIDCPGTTIGGALENVNAHRRLQDRHPQDSIYCYDYSNRPVVLFNSESSRRDLHAQPEEIAGRWIRCTKRLKYRKEKISVIQHHLNLTLKGYRAFIYSGDHDMAISYIGTLEWIGTLNYAELESWQPWFVGDQIAGYTIRYEHNLLFATVKR